MKKLFCASTILTLAGCNTIKGLGADTAKAGASLSKAARDAKN